MHKYVYAFFLLLACLNTFKAFASPPPVEAYAKAPVYTAASLSPNGEKVAMLAKVEGETRLVVLTTEGKLLQQVAFENVIASHVTFVTNDYVVVRASELTRLAGFRGEFRLSGGISVNVATGETVQLLDNTRDIFPGQSGLGHILGPGASPNTVIMRAFMGSPGSINPNNNLLQVSLITGRGQKIGDGRGVTRQWSAIDGGDTQARIDYENSSNRFTVSLGQNARWREVYSLETERPPFGLHGWMPDNSGLVVVTEFEGEDRFETLRTLSFDGTLSGPVFPPVEKDVRQIYTDRENRLVGVRYVSDFGESYTFLDEELSGIVDKVLARYDGAMVQLLDWSDDKKRSLYRIFHPVHGHAYILYDRDAASFKTLVNLSPDIPASEIAAVYAISYPARDGLMIPALLTVPRSTNLNSGPKLPTIMLPHGGPASYDTLDFDWLAQFLASRGYAVLQPNFRGSDGFGLAFEAAGRGEWAGKMQNDLDDGLQALADMGVADSDRACIVGASYGGYAALVGATLTPDTYECAISINGVADLNAMLSGDRANLGSNHWVIDYWEDIIAKGDAQRTKLNAISPITHAAQTKAPVLLIHGADDLVVPFSQSRNMQQALDRAGKDVSLLRLKTGDHSLSFDQDRAETLLAIEGFLKKHLPTD